MVPQVAIEAARLTLIQIAGYIITHLAAVFRGYDQTRKTPEVLDNARQALIRTQSFLGEIRSFNNSPLLHERHSNIIHSIDHLYRLIGACRESGQIQSIAEDPGLNRIALLLVDNAESIHAWLQGDRAVNPRETAEKTSMSIAEIRKNQRRDILNKTSSGEINADEAFALMEAVRWLDRIAFHVWRAVIHLEDIRTASPPEKAGKENNGEMPT
jgi:phosphate:Na+ symporter